MSPHILDNPVWHALGGPHSHFDVGNGVVRRYPSDVAMLTAVAEPVVDLSALPAAVNAGESIILAVVGGGATLPPGFETVFSGPGVQMIADRLSLVPERPAFVDLGAADAAEMLALVELTRPGPFQLRTHEMGRYVGVRIDGALVAMAGERMRLPGYTEISAVCTHPDHRGHGYARMLVSEIAEGIIGRGEVPFLHTFAANTLAIATYEKLGFALRTPIGFSFLRRLAD